MGVKEGKIFMLIDSNQIVSMTEANQNFSQVATLAQKNGCAVIFKNNQPKFVLLCLDSCKIQLPQTDERLDKACKKKIERAKWL
jgi:antitoxin Phd